MSSPKPTKKELVTEFRTREILAAARNLLEQSGVDRLTMDGIAAAAGVAKGTLYLYFPSKEELIQELLSQVGDNIITNLQSIIKTPLESFDWLRGISRKSVTIIERGALRTAWL